MWRNVFPVFTTALTGETWPSGERKPNSWRRLREVRVPYRQYLREIFGRGVPVGEEMNGVGISVWT